MEGYMTDKLKAELDHYAQLKKDMHDKLAELRNEFPDVSADAIIAKYRTKAERGSSSTHTAPGAKKRS